MLPVGVRARAVVSVCVCVLRVRVRVPPLGAAVSPRQGGCLLSMCPRPHARPLCSRRLAGPATTRIFVPCLIRVLISMPADWLRLGC